MKSVYLQTKEPLDKDEFEDIIIYFSKSLLGKDNEEDILWDLAKNCISKLGFIDCVIYLVDHDNNCLIQKAAYGPKNPKDKIVCNPIRINLGSGISGSVAVSGIAEIINDTSKDPRYIDDDESRFSEITVPIATEDTIYGVIDCEHTDVNFFTPQHLKMLSAIASICAIKINKVRADKLVREKQENLLKVKQEMVEVKLKAFNSQMNPHFVFNALSAIQYFITSENKKSALNYLSIFSKLIRFYLKHLEIEKVDLKEEIEMLGWYLKLQKLRYNDRFEYEMVVKNDSIGSGASIPSFILQTLFENIIEHATYNHYTNCIMIILFKVERSFITVDIRYTYSLNENDKLKYTPEYRERVLQWQNQIDLLNTVKQYGIQKEITLTENADSNSETILLKLPNFN